MTDKILLLGASGYVGRYLNSVFDVTAITRNECNLTDINSVEKLLKIHKPDIVINCAANVNVETAIFKQECFIENMNIFLNLYTLKDNFGKLINFGSGAEFDRSSSIDKALEKDILKIKPKDHYGLSKNIISNICLSTENFYTLRLFGCFHHSESDEKLFKKLSRSKQDIVIADRYFDYIWMEDLYPIVKYFIEETPVVKDINLVYKQKFLLSELVSKFTKIHNLKVNVLCDKSALNYTGSSTLIDSLNLQLSNIDTALERYKI
jgi:GDP-L-fucose synthase